MYLRQIEAIFQAGKRRTVHCLSKNHATFIFMITSSNDQFSYFFSVKFRKDVQRKLELKLTPPLNLMPRYLVKSKWSAIQLVQQLIQSDENMFNYGKCS